MSQDVPPGAPPPATPIGRFAPSATGPAHPGTLLAALLCWLDARSSRGRVILRLEDLDPQRCQPEFARGLCDALEWLGLDWDGVLHQSEVGREHDRALDRLAELGVLYPCRCTRADLRAAAVPTPDGGFRYPGSCRARRLPAAGWRGCDEPLRVRLPEGVVQIADGSGVALDQDPAAAFGDPVVRRRDGAMAYHLASVVDDAASGVTRVVRGRDLATATATQVRLQQLLGLTRPRYHHHFLLLEEHGGKLAKLHGAVGWSELQPRYTAAELCGWLAHAAGLLEAPAPCAPSELVSDFAWARVRAADRLVRWDGVELRLAD